MVDQPKATLDFYAQNSARYAADTGDSPPSRHLDAFMAALPAGACVLELGCGSGRDSAVLLSHGFAVTPTDGTPEMAAEAERRLGVPVSVLPFAEIAAVSAYEAVWANACLLHVPRKDLPGILQAIAHALRPDGLFYASYKAGEAEGFDDLGRYYNYPDRQWLMAAYGKAWSSIAIEEVSGSGYDRKPTRWLHVTARSGR
ncbi:SAM-dependent methyltransferase [Neorhizobium galegae]|uniref:class I SAM-dependent methyltransferase n=1 Tax=Rhizobium/Agrobacterium group TaxID=227290 RepID=UPI001AE5BB3D|nr:class I SAM-dependent methyltransferase [Neorhizobium galegae]MBP2548269.1 SAM-dependent methyltransferase [Neorhizobium galegae]